MKIRKASALSSTSSKKQCVSDKRFKLDAPENQLAIVVYSGGVEPIASRKKKKPCKTRKPRETIHNGPNPTPEIPKGFKDMIINLGGTDCQLIIQKGLCQTDLSRSHCRLSMPQSLWRPNQVLTSELVRMFDFESENSGRNYVSLRMIDTKMRLWESVSLKRWNMTKAMFVIAGQWNDVVVANDLKTKDIVQIWCFKFIETGRFGLAMVKIEDGNSSDNGDIGCSSESQMRLSSHVLPLSMHPHLTNSASSSTYNYSDHCQYPTMTYFDFLNAESYGSKTDSNECDQERVEPDQVAGSESSDSASNRLEGSSNEAVLQRVTDIPSSDIDLSLHL